MNHLEKYLRQQIIDDALLVAKKKKPNPGSIEDIETQGLGDMFDTAPPTGMEPPELDDWVDDAPEIEDGSDPKATPTPTPKPKSPKKPKKPKGPSVVDIRRAAREKGVDLDPTDPTKPMSIATTDFETGDKKTHTPQQALDAFKYAQELRTGKLTGALGKEQKARKKYKSLLKTDKTDPDYKEKIDKAERKLRLAQDDVSQARSIPEPDITNFKPRLSTGRKVLSMAKRAATVGASAIGTQILGKLGDELARNAPIGVPGGGDRASRERAKQGAQNISQFLRKGLLGDTQAEPTETTARRFGLVGGTSLYLYDKAKDKLSPASAADRDDATKRKVLQGLGRKRDVFSATRKGLGTSPYAQREIENLRLLKQLKPK